jgi:lysine 6-dehydrogenase
MQVLVLGGCGSQGRAALYDLSRNESVDQVTCADIQPELLESFDFIDQANIRAVRIDATDMPSDSFIDQLNKRGININETIEQPT